jgi:hypothetical protein
VSRGSALQMRLQLSEPHSLPVSCLLSYCSAVGATLVLARCSDALTPGLEASRWLYILGPMLLNFPASQPTHTSSLSPQAFYCHLHPETRTVGIQVRAYPEFRMVAEYTSSHPCPQGDPAPSLMMSEQRHSLRGGPRWI